MSITASQARQQLFRLIEQVNDDHTAVEIVSRRGTAYLVSADEYRSLHARGGQVSERELIDPPSPGAASARSCSG